MRASPTWVLTVASMKMFYRDRQALFWTLFLPLLIMLIFGFLNFGALGSVGLGIVDLAGNEASVRFVEGLRSVEALDVTGPSPLESERSALSDGDRDLVLVLPPGFGASQEQAAVRVLYNDGRPQEVQVGQAMVRQALDEVAFQVTGTPRLFTLSAEPVTSRNLRYIDFLLPGVVAMSIMQMGIFSVAFGFVQLKQRGILRRLLATPAHPVTFLFSQVATRLTVSVLQTLVLLGAGMILFNVQFVGNLAAVLALAVVGAAVFLSMGFAISGWAKSEDVAAPVANVVAMPMMFLSGVFFPRESMPMLLQSVTDYLPLTYLADAMRAVAVEGLTLWSQWPELLGLGAWLVASYVVAVRLFRWE